MNFEVCHIPSYIQPIRHIASSSLRFPKSKQFQVKLVAFREVDMYIVLTFPFAEMPIQLKFQLSFEIDIWHVHIQLFDKCDRKRVNEAPFHRT